MSDKLTASGVEDEGFYTVTRFEPEKQEDGSIVLLGCGCGCSKNVAVSNTVANRTSDEAVILLNK